MTVRGNYMAFEEDFANLVDEDLIELDREFSDSWLTKILLELQGLRSGRGTGQTKCALCHSLIDKG